MRRFQVSQRVDHLFIDVKTWANRMIPFKNLIIRLFEGKGRASGVKKKSVIVRITTREIIYKGKVERRIIVRASRFLASFLISEKRRKSCSRRQQFPDGRPSSEVEIPIQET